MLRFTSSCVVVVSAMFLTAGCQPSVGTPPPEAPGTTAAVVEPAEVVPEFIPERREGGTARENQPHIDWVVEQAREASSTRVLGLGMVEELVEGGYLRELMELTPDMSLIKLPADSTTLAIRFDQECVLAQWGADWYASSVEPVIAGGRCLLGETVSLD